MRLSKFTGTSSTGLCRVTRTRELVHRWLLRQTGPWWHLASTHRRPTLTIPGVTLQHLAKVLSRKRAAKMAWRWVEASLKHEPIVRSDWWTKMKRTLSGSHIPHWLIVILSLITTINIEHCHSLPSNDSPNMCRHPAPCPNAPLTVSDQILPCTDRNGQVQM